VEEVVGLQQHVAELGVGDALVGVLEPGPHRLLGQHGVDGEVLAHVAEEVDDRHGRQPVGVVDQGGARRARAEVQHGLQLPADARGVGLDLLPGEERPLGPAAARVADERRPPAHEDQRPVPVGLEPAQGHHAQEAADVQAVGRGVHAVVQDEGLGRHALAQPLVGDLVEQAPPSQVGEEVARHGADRTRAGPQRARDSPTAPGT
jgi:hypothetical protein